MLEINGKNLCEYCFSEIEENAYKCPNCSSEKNNSKYPTALPEGTILAGRYVVGRVLGKGGFGITYLCYDTRENKTVAVKEYLPDHLTHRNTGETHVSTYSGETEEYFRTGAQKFFEEAKLVSNFNGNPNIISVYEFFYENNTTYFVMEYLDGVDLKTYIKQKGGKIPEGEALYIADKVIQALMIVHSTNILHRDISPDNIFICSDGKIKLIDFGAARQVMGEVSKSLSVVLKEGFAPIEQYQTRGKQGPWTDIYALGATLYYSLTGEVLDNAMTRMTDDSQMHLESVSPKLADIITKMLEIKKEDRYQNAFELSQAFSVFSKDVEEDDDGDDKEKVSVIEKIKTFTSNIDVKTKKRILAVAGSVAAIIIAVIVAVVAIPDRSNVTESSGGDISGNEQPGLNGTIDVNQFTEETKTTKKNEKTTNKKAEEDKTSATKKTSTTKKKTSSTKQNVGTANWSTAEVVDYFNKSVNGVKTGAKSVKQHSIVHYLAAPQKIGDELSSIYKMLGGDSWLDGMLRSNSAGEKTYIGADIKKNYPVENESWASKLTAADVSSATCTEANGVYTIKIVTKTDAKTTSVKHSQGHNPKVFSVVLPDTIKENIPGIASGITGDVAVGYSSGTVTITVDVATGHVLTAIYDTHWTINFDEVATSLPFGTKSTYTIRW